MQSTSEEFAHVPTCICCPNRLKIKKKKRRDFGFGLATNWSQENIVNPCCGIIMCNCVCCVSGNVSINECASASKACKRYKIIINVLYVALILFSDEWKCRLYLMRFFLFYCNCVKASTAIHLLHVLVLRLHSRIDTINCVPQNMLCAQQLNIEILKHYLPFSSSSLTSLLLFALCALWFDWSNAN